MERALTISLPGYVTLQIAGILCKTTNKNGVTHTEVFTCHQTSTEATCPLYEWLNNEESSIISNKELFLFAESLSVDDGGGGLAEWTDAG